MKKIGLPQTSEAERIERASITSNKSGLAFPVAF